MEEHVSGKVEDTHVILGKIKNKSFKVEISQYNNVNRLEFKLSSKSIKEIILLPQIEVSKYYINYPFGIEETKRSKIQTLDFMWLKGEKDGILFVQRNSQQFIIERDESKVRNLLYSGGEFEFAIIKTSASGFDNLLNHVNSYNFKFLGVILTKSLEFEQKFDSFLSIESVTNVTNLWRRDNNAYLRIFNPSEVQKTVKLDGPMVEKQLKEINSIYEELGVVKNNEIKLDPWKIRTLMIEKLIKNE